MIKSNPFIRRFKVWTWILLVLIVLITYVTLFQPYRSALEKMTLENYVLISKASVSTVDQFILRSHENANNFSHALIEHTPLDDYLNGKLTLDELKKISADGFLYEASKQPHLIAGARLLFGSVNATIGSEYLPALLSQRNDYNSSHIQTVFLTGRETPGLFVAVPLMTGGMIYGYDLILYDLAALAEPLNRNHMTFSFIDLTQQNSLFEKGAKLKEAGGVMLYDNGWYTGFVLPIDGTNQALHMSTSNEDLYERVDDIILMNLLGFALAVGAVLFLSNRFIVFHIRHLMAHAEKSKEKYMDMANRDQLTGTFSRRYLEEWKISNAPLSLLELTHYILAMVDVNDLKVINDTYGHKTGDLALKYVADTMGRTLRSEDIIIRYGGDEFLVILSSCSLDEANHIFSRINQALLLDQPFDFPLSISYGTEYLTKVELMDEVIHSADEKMYALKMKNRAVFA